MSETRFGSSRPRPRLKRSESQWRDRDRDMLISDMIRVFWLVGLDFFSLTGLTQPSKVRIWCCKKQTQSNKLIDFDWLYLVWLKSFCLAFLCLMTQQDFDILWMLRPRLIETGKFIGYRDRDSSRLRDFLDVETETHRDWEIRWMSRLRLIETWKFHRCWDRDILRLRNILVVETETNRDWAKDIETKTLSRVSLISGWVNLI